MTRIALAPCSPFSVTDRLMTETAEFARDRGVLLHTHLAETEDETRFCLETHGSPPARPAWRNSGGWEATCGSRTACTSRVRRTRPAGRDRDRCGALPDLEHAPVVRSGAPCPRCSSGGSRVGLAVDGSASNDTSDMLGELRSCLLVQLLTYGPEAVSAERVARLATRGGADILGRDETGSIEVGKAADVIAVDMSRLGYAGAFSDPLAAIVYAGLRPQGRLQHRQRSRRRRGQETGHGRRVRDRGHGQRSVGSDARACRRGDALADGAAQAMTSPPVEAAAPPRTQLKTPADVRRRLLLPQLSVPPTSRRSSSPPSPHHRHRAGGSKCRWQRRARPRCGRPIGSHGRPPCGGPSPASELCVRRCRRPRALRRKAGSERTQSWSHARMDSGDSGGTRPTGSRRSRRALPSRRSGRWSGWTCRASRLPECVSAGGS